MLASSFRLDLRGRAIPHHSTIARSPKHEKAFKDLEVQLRRLRSFDFAEQAMRPLEDPPQAQKDCCGSICRVKLSSLLRTD